MVKGGRGLFSKAVIISIGVVLLNFGFLFFRSFNSISTQRSITANIIKSALVDSFNLSVSSKIFLIIQFGLIAGVLFYTFIYERKMKKMEKELISSHMEKAGPNETDLDVLYEVLKSKGKIGLSAIANSFRINKEVAMEWCKILELGDLAVIEYPGFGEPMIKIKKIE
ncbi:MAG: hypothetical protein WC494_00965 [Candidatus Pacearchaeota archaeon]